MTMRSMITIALFLLPLGAAAEIGPVGSEFQVNRYTAESQESPAVAAGTDGTFVLVWDSFGQDGSHKGVFGQRYSSAGQPAGTEFQVNTYTPSIQAQPAVAVAQDGASLVVWTSYQGGSKNGVFGQRYDSAGQPVGTEFQVNTYTVSFHSGPELAVALDGAFVVVWSSLGQDGDGYGVFAQRYDNAGQPAGTEFQVNTYTTSIQSDPAVAVDLGGAFVVAWASSGQDGDVHAVFGQRYSSAGQPAGTEFQVNTYTTNGQNFPAVAVDLDGAFVVAWESFGQDGSGPGVFGQRYSSAGQPAGTEFQVNTYTTSDLNATFPAVAAGADGAFVVVWNHQPQDGNWAGVFGQRYSSAGQPAGTEFQVNTYTVNNQREPALAAGANGAFVVAWESYQQDGHLQGVFAQRFGALPPSNDDCTGATVISSLPYSDTVDVTTATTDPSDPVRCDSSQGANTVWYSYTPLTDTLLLIDPTDSMNDSPGISIYTGACGALTEVLCTADAEKVLFAAQGGTTYLIEAAGGGATTPILVLSIEALGCPPAPDPSCGAADKAPAARQGGQAGQGEADRQVAQRPGVVADGFRQPALGRRDRVRAVPLRSERQPGRRRAGGPRRRHLLRQAVLEGARRRAAIGQRLQLRRQGARVVRRLQAAAQGRRGGQLEGAAEGQGTHAARRHPRRAAEQHQRHHAAARQRRAVRERDADRHQEAGSTVLQREGRDAVA